MPELLTRLAALDTCACSDAMDSLRLPGVAHGLRPVTVSRRVAGRVLTVTLGPVDEAGGTAPRHLGTAAIEAARPGDVIVVAAAGRTYAAGWGGVLSLAAMRRGVRAVIVDGACRDVDETRDLGLPVFALAATPATARGRHVEVSWNTPVEVRGVPVRPGDLVIADGSGVVFLPAGGAEAIVAAAERISQREALMAARISGGEPVSAVMSADYEAMLNQS